MAQAWECKSKDGWSKYPPTISAQLERTFKQACNRGKFELKFARQFELQFTRQFGDSDQVYSYTCDFKRMKQINDATGSERDFRRTAIVQQPRSSLHTTPDVARSTANLCRQRSKEQAVWECRSKDGWSAYPANISAQLEQAFNTGCTTPRFSRQFGDANRVYSYACDLSRMVQINDATKNERAIRRYPA